MIDLAIPGIVYQYAITAIDMDALTRASITRRGRGMTAHVSLDLEDAVRLQDVLERSYDHLYVAAGTDAQVRLAYAVAQYAERLARELKGVRVNVR